MTKPPTYELIVLEVATNLGPYTTSVHLVREIEFALNRIRATGRVPLTTTCTRFRQSLINHLPTWTRKETFTWP